MHKSLRVKIILIQSVIIAGALILMGVVLYQMQKRSLIRQFINSANGINALVRIQSNGDINKVKRNIRVIRSIHSISMASDILLVSKNNTKTISNMTHLVRGKNAGIVKNMIVNCNQGFINTGGMHLIKIFRISTTGGGCMSLIVVSDSSYLTKGLFQLMGIISAYILLNFFILTIIAWFVIDRYTVVPLHKFEQAVEGVRNGDYSQIINMPEATELHQIVRAFNTMTDAIKTKEQNLKDTIKTLKETRDLVIKRERLATIGTLASGISHEIGNPLSAIVAMLETLKHDVSGDVQKGEIINRSLNEAYRIDALIKQLLLYVRQKPVVPSNVNIRALAEDVMSTIAMSKPLGDIIATLNIKSGIVHKTDYEKLRQILLNLIANAVDAMNGKGELSIKAAIQTDTLVIEVSDTGEGVSEEKLESIFEPFFTTKPSGKGTGLGLAIVKNLVQDLNGEIFVQSEEGVGITFTIKLRK